MNVRLLAPLMASALLLLAVPTQATTTTTSSSTTTTTLVWTSTGGPNGGPFINHIGFGDSCGVRATVATKGGTGVASGVYQISPQGVWGNLLPNEALFGPFGVSPTYGTGTMFVFYGNGYLRKTTDGGTTWVSPNEPVINNGCGWANWTPNDLAVDPGNNGILWASGSIYAFMKVAGCSRTEADTGMPGGIMSMGPFVLAPSDTTVKYQALQLSGPTQKVYVSATDVSDPAGLSWTDATSDLPSDALVADVAVDPSNPNLAYLAVGGGQAGKVYHRTPTGNWVGTSLPSATGVTQIAVDPTNGVVYAGGNVSASSIAVWRSADGGSTWTQLTSTGLSGSTVVVMAVGPTGDHLWVGSTDGILYKYSLGKSCGC